MKKFMAAIVWVVTTVALSFADSDVEASAKDTKKVVQSNFLETAQRGVKLSGYVDAGYSYNFTGPNTSRVTGRLGTDTAQYGDFNLYAVKFALEKALTSENEAQAGFRTDVMIGEDANYLIQREVANSYNTNDDQNSNQLFLEQAYVSIRAPVGNGWDFKVGKFVSILGYEVIERPANMNITYGLLWNQLPLWYTGVLSSYRFDDYLDAKLGVVNGSNSDNNTTTSDLGDGCAVLAALNVTSSGGNANWSNNFQYSSNNDSDTLLSSGQNESTTPTGVEVGASGTGYTFIYNSWGNWAPKFADDKLLFAFNAILGTSSVNGTIGSNIDPSQPGVTWYGAGAYTKYQFNDWFYLAGRGEYLGGNNMQKVFYPAQPGVFPGQDGANAGMSLWEWTLTAGFNVIDNLMIRAEYRLDWGVNAVNDSTFGLGGSLSSGPAHYAGAEVVYSF